MKKHNRKYITKEFSFEAAHKLYDKTLLKETNEELFGACCNLHGHSYKLFISISGKEKNGMIINFKDLKHIVNMEIIDRFDHKVLNDDPLYKDGRLSTCENQVDDMWDILEKSFDGKDYFLEKIKLYETAGSSCTRHE